MNDDTSPPSYEESQQIPDIDLEDEDEYLPPPPPYYQTEAAWMAPPEDDVIIDMPTTGRRQETFGLQPRSMHCAHCDTDIVTVVSVKTNFRWYMCLVALLMCLLMPCIAFVLCVIFRPRKQLRHKCPNCKRTLYQGAGVST